MEPAALRSPSPVAVPPTSPTGEHARSARARLLLPLAAAALLLPLAACGSADDATSADAASAVQVGAEPAAPAPAGSDLARSGEDAMAYDATLASGGSVAAPADSVGQETTVPREPAIIRTGTVSLRADDVDRARFDVQKIVDGAGGEVADDRTKADDDGGARFSRSVVRVPVAVFDETMQALETLESATRLGATTAAEDVTTEVIDTGVRVALQRRSIARISALLDRAASIRDIVNLENELARREADLGSLEQQQDYLADRTSMATITIAIERTDPDAPAPEEERDGFVGGLERGWDAFSDAAGAGLTALGVAVPFLGLGAVVVGGVAVARRRSRPAAGPASGPA